MWPQSSQNAFMKDGFDAVVPAAAIRTKPLIR